MKLSTKLRLLAGLDKKCRYPIQIVRGNKPPTKVGQSYGWETRGGKPIYHPNAYKRKGWSSMVYVSSTNAVEVGEDYLLGLAVEKL